MNTAMPEVMCAIHGLKMYHDTRSPTGYFCDSCISSDNAMKALIRKLKSIRKLAEI